ncbi:MAG: hypothetical protein Q8K65_05770 [Alphaproteobacteria bacterium]|nr:hypothetical protein [Alphaproteobacteria bacterium]
MAAKLTDIFNAADQASRSLAARLDQILEALPEKIAELKAQHPDKDILLVQVPIDNKYDKNKSPEERSGDVAAAMARVGRVAAAFEKELVERFPQINCNMSSSNSVWGDFLSLTIVTSEESLVARLHRAGISPQNPQEAFEGMQRIMPKRALAEYFSLHQSIEMVHHAALQMRVNGGDPETMGPVTFEGMGMPNPAKYHGRYAFWDVDGTWPKPALLPEFKHIFDKKNKPPQP